MRPVAGEAADGEADRTEHRTAVAQVEALETGLMEDVVGGRSSGASTERAASAAASPTTAPTSSLRSPASQPTRTPTMRRAGVGIVPPRAHSSCIRGKVDPGPARELDRL